MFNDDVCFPVTAAEETRPQFVSSFSSDEEGARSSIELHQCVETWQLHTVAMFAVQTCPATLNQSCIESGWANCDWTALPLWIILADFDAVPSHSQSAQLSKMMFSVDSGIGLVNQSRIWRLESFLNLQRSEAVHRIVDARIEYERISQGIKDDKGA